MLDRTKMTDRKAVLMVAETAKSLGQDVQGLALNRSTVRRRRQAHRALISSRLREEFQADATIPLVVHWDGKMLRDLTGNETIDRLPVLVSGIGISQLLVAAKLQSSTGQAQAAAVYGALNNWGIKDRVRAMSFDTTSSNTGLANGACVLLEKMLGINLLSLACRHHIFELVIGAVFKECMGSSQAPQVLMFKRFQSRWQAIDQTNYATGMDDEEVAALLLDVREDLLQFAECQLRNAQPRDDYREFLELSMIFLGGVPPRGIRFIAPGAMHHARWMSKVLYSLKIWMFRSQFHLRPKEAKGLRDICIFAVRLYLKIWITAPLAAAAPQNDLRFLQALLDYDTIHNPIAKAASAKMSRHLWYLSEELVGLALFDKDVPTAVKRELVKAIKEKDGADSPPKRIEVDLQSVRNISLVAFATKHSHFLFERMELPDGFLAVDPEEWNGREDFEKAATVIRELKVVNDHAERGVALVQELSGTLTKNEEQFQFMMHVVQENRRLFPNALKQTITAQHGATGISEPKETEV
jgi:hypothetical protein